MKTTSIILALLLTLNVPFLFASNMSGDPLKNITAKTEITVKLPDLAPVLPKEADFSDQIETVSLDDADNFNLVPSLPKEAEFEETGLSYPADLNILMPKTPKSADFSDQ
ncbi:MAG: hypothetical protein M0P58_07275 [Bacteroidales bacterium]|nr:hypothetical protein [Bacteroidales bacterium]